MYPLLPIFAKDFAFLLVLLALNAASSSSLFFIATSLLYAMAISLGINSVENKGNVPKEFWEKPWIGEIDDAAKMRNEEMKN